MTSNTAADTEDDELSGHNLTIELLMLRKPTELKKVISSIPIPSRAVPKNGLPKWYKLGLECKLPVPTKHKLLFSRGKIGEDIRRIGLGTDQKPNFDLKDPNCNYVSYDYEPLHDPHLAHHFRQKPHRQRMKDLGLCTPDNRAVCSLKQFNQYRKYLYIKYMDRIHDLIATLNERQRDNLTLQKVEQDIQVRAKAFRREEKARALLEKYIQMHGDEIAEKKRLAKEKETKIRERMQRLVEYKDKKRKELLKKKEEKNNKVKQRVTAATEMEIKRKITMIRAWRTNEKRRIARVTQRRLAEEKRKREEADNDWEKRFAEQNRKIQEEATLLKIYTEKMNTRATKRQQRAREQAFNIEMEFQKIKHLNWQIGHGAAIKAHKLVNKFGVLFEKSKRGAKGMSSDLARSMAEEAMNSAFSVKGDPFMILSQARARMDNLVTYPAPPIRILEELIETVVVEFARRQVNFLLRYVEDLVQNNFLQIIFKPSTRKKHSGKTEISRLPFQPLDNSSNKRRTSDIVFAQGIERIARDPMEDDLDELKNVKVRKPTPMPSIFSLAQATFMDKIDDLPEPTTTGTTMSERAKLFEMLNKAMKVMYRLVGKHVDERLDLIIKSVTMPYLRRTIDWGEAVEFVADAVLNNEISVDNPSIKLVSLYLSFRVLHFLQAEMKKEKARQKLMTKKVASEPQLSTPEKKVNLKTEPLGHPLAI